ncbi:hypothetical protein [Pseudoscardovia suis]|uniref:Uncharacterized protein n=1 Tax=Pseudoscardovia suis TaxID=987063 RepID=A0A261EPW1_9BIFI|nr:hypothetical protein [Pseudoscardovia suis]OZG48883.1 hypothetical protein PSSU_1707 [Pseudoscardovia suis]PJJ63939.1 hypothetical protein CLV65_1562 [Pseudoscardovia suis]
MDPVKRLEAIRELWSDPLARLEGKRKGEHGWKPVSRSRALDAHGKPAYDSYRLVRDYDGDFDGRFPGLADYVAEVRLVFKPAELEDVVSGGLAG